MFEKDVKNYAMRLKTIIIPWLLLVLTMIPINDCYGQSNGIPVEKGDDTTKNIVIHFQLGKTVLNSDYMSNPESLMKLDKLLTDTIALSRMDSIIIVAAASPEGVLEFNNYLAKHRADAIRKYIQWKYPLVGHNKIKTLSIGEDWERLKAMIELDADIPSREKVLEVIDQDINSATKEWRLKQIGGGTAWVHIVKKKYLQYLRTGTVCILYAKAAEPPQQVSIPQEITPITPHPEPVIVPEPVPESEKEPLPVPTIETKWAPLLAIKTNLLFDAVSALNVELEVPIGQRFSIAGEWIFPWWLWDEKQHCLELLSGNLEGRYWLGYRDRRPQLTGWFAGLYAGGGLYDLEWNKKGYQGEFFIATGISAGYTHTILNSKNWRMEYSLGVGYLQTDYRRYEARFNTIDNEWHLIRMNNGTQTWIGPTRAKISLVWMLNYKTRKGGGK